MDNQMGYGIGNDLFDIRYLDDSTKGLLAEGWQQMQDTTDPNKQILFKDYSGQMKDAAFKTLLSRKIIISISQEVTTKVHSQPA